MEFSWINTYDRKYSDRELIARILVYFKPYVRLLVIVLGIAAATDCSLTRAGCLGPILRSNEFT